MTGDFLANISIYSVFPPFLLGLIFITSLNRFATFVWTLVLAGALTEVAVLLFATDNSFPFVNVYTLIEYSIIATAFHSYIKSRTARNFIVYISILFLLFALYGFLFIQGFYTTNSFTIMLQSFLIIGMAIFSLQQLARNVKDEIIRNPVFYFSSSMLIYFAGNLFTFGYGDKYIQNIESFPIDIWKIHSVFNIILNLGLFLTIWFGRKEITMSSS